jgi:hypothetical protein
MGSCPRVLHTVSGMHEKDRIKELWYFDLEQRFSSREQQCRSSSGLDPIDVLGSPSYAAQTCDLQHEGSAGEEAWLSWAL